MSRANSQDGGASVVTFHARVAGVGLITTVVVLAAACAVFLMQQWAVARAEAHRHHDSLAGFTATAAARTLATGEWVKLHGSMGKALATAPDVVSVRLADTHGQIQGQYVRAARPD